MTPRVGVPAAAVTGRLVVFEGPDGVGKSTLVQAVAERLVADGTPVTTLAFPGREPGTLGHLVYGLHHDPAAYGVSSVPAASLQLFHVAAHLAAIDERIRPAVDAGQTVLLDRYWWSTWVYGVVGGAPRATLDAMIALERHHWGHLQPDLICLVTRRTPLRDDVPRDRWDALVRGYDALATAESGAGDGARAATLAAITRVPNDDALSAAVDVVVRHLAERGNPREAAPASPNAGTSYTSGSVA